MFRLGVQLRADGQVRSVRAWDVLFEGGPVRTRRGFSVFTSRRVFYMDLEDAKLLFPGDLVHVDYETPSLWDKFKEAQFSYARVSGVARFRVQAPLSDRREFICIGKLPNASVSMPVPVSNVHIGCKSREKGYVVRVEKGVVYRWVVLPSCVSTTVKLCEAPGLRLDLVNKLNRQGFNCVSDVLNNSRFVRLMNDSTVTSALRGFSVWDAIYLLFYFFEYTYASWSSLKPGGLIIKFEEFKPLLVSAAANSVITRGFNACPPEDLDVRARYRRDMRLLPSRSRVSEDDVVKQAFDFMLKGVHWNGKREDEVRAAFLSLKLHKESSASESIADETNVVSGANKVVFQLPAPETQSEVVQLSVLAAKPEEVQASAVATKPEVMTQTELQRSADLVTEPTTKASPLDGVVDLKNVDWNEMELDKFEVDIDFADGRHALYVVFSNHMKHCICIRKLPVIVPRTDKGFEVVVEILELLHRELLESVYADFELRLKRYLPLFWTVIENTMSLIH